MGLKRIHLIQQKKPRPLFADPTFSTTQLNVILVFRKEVFFVENFESEFMGGLFFGELIEQFN